MSHLQSVRVSARLSGGEASPILKSRSKRSVERLLPHAKANSGRSTDPSVSTKTAGSVGSATETPTALGQAGSHAHGTTLTKEERRLHRS